MPGNSNNRLRFFSDDPEENRSTLVEHLEELRDRIIRVAFAIAIGWGAGWFLEPPAYTFLHDMVQKAITLHLPKDTHYEEAFLNATDAFMLQMRLSFLIGVIIVVPYAILQVWGFIAPGLKKNERQPFARLAPFAAGLFIMGAGFSWVILPTAIGWFVEFLGSFKGAALNQEPGTLVFFCLKMVLAFGLGFQLPLVVWVLGALNLLSAETLLKYWRQSATAIFVLAAIVTPSNDAFSMLMMALPLTALFMISVFVVKGTQKKQRLAREKEAAAFMSEGAPDNDIEPTSLP